MKKFITLGLFLILLQGCNLEQELTAINGNLDDEKIWVWAQINVPEEGDKIDTYYYFGKASKTLFNGIADNSIKTGFILLKDIRYWNDDSVIEEYDDEIDDDVMVFRIENIVHIIKMKRTPEPGFQYKDITNEEPDETNNNIIKNRVGENINIES